MRGITVDGGEDVKRTIDAAADWAESRSLPDAGTASLRVYGDSHSNPPQDFVEPSHTGNKIVLVDAINHALAQLRKSIVKGCLITE